MFSQNIIWRQVFHINALLLVKLKNLYLYLVNPKFSFLKANICSTLVLPSLLRSSGFYHKSNLSVPWDLYTMHRNLAAARSSLLLTYTELCLWDSSWHSHRGQDLGLIKQLRLLWQHILASVVSLWISLFSNCFLSTRCWPWLPHSAPATGFSYLLVSHAFALGNWPELFSSPQPLSPRLTVPGTWWYLIMTESMPSDWTWPSSFAAPAELAWVWSHCDLSTVWNGTSLLSVVYDASLLGAACFYFLVTL